MEVFASLLREGFVKQLYDYQRPTITSTAPKFTCLCTKLEEASGLIIRAVATIAAGWKC
jgi:hypothetical protein